MQHTRAADLRTIMPRHANPKELTINLTAVDDRHAPRDRPTSSPIALEGIDLSSLPRTRASSAGSTSPSTAESARHRCPHSQPPHQLLHRPRGRRARQKVYWAPSTTPDPGKTPATDPGGQRCRSSRRRTTRRVVCKSRKAVCRRPAACRKYTTFARRLGARRNSAW